MVEQEVYGQIAGVPVHRFTLKNAAGGLLRLINYGAAVTELHVPDRHGQLDDVVLGYDTLEGYLQGTGFLGATVGRFANRIRNGRFELDDQKFQLEANDPPHHLHGGARGWDKLLWQAQIVDAAGGASVTFSHASSAGEAGYPGNVAAQVRYTLTDQNEVHIEHSATSDAPTPLSMAHHSYFNLGGHASGSVLHHELELFADAYTPGDPIVPTGEVAAVRGTAFDFTAPRPIGRELPQLGTAPAGFDHNFVVRGDATQFRPVARLRDPRSGRVLSLHANQPGLQFYSGNYLNGALGKGARHVRHAGLCLETQAFPDAINVPAWREQALLTPGNGYRHRMELRFSAE